MRSLVVLGAVGTPVPVRTLPEQALYSLPNPDRTRKQCSNCVLFREAEEQCVIHDSDVVVTTDSICGHHVFGKPSEGLVDRTDMQPVLPELSGLRQVEQGASCDLCRYFVSTGQASGNCQVITDPDDLETTLAVQPMAICTHWEPRDAEPAPVPRD